MKKQLKLVAFTVLMLVAGIANAQQTSGSITKTAGDKGNDKGANKVVRVIDNKGTIKYLQSKNGITMLTNETNEVTTTTWQLGGTLSTNTTISFGTGVSSPTFTLDGKKFTLENIGTVSSTAVDGNAVTATADTSATATQTGWTFLVRDEQTGEVRKMLASDALKVQSFHAITTVANTNAADGSTYSATTLGGSGATDGLKLDGIVLTDYRKVEVFRNGAKLRAGAAVGPRVDYYLSNDGTNTYVKFNQISTTSSIHFWQFYLEDEIEVHYTK